VRFRGKVLFIDGPSDAEVLVEAGNKFKTHFDWTLPKESLLLLRGSSCVLRNAATLGEVNEDPS
jgi:hypothetical protein